MRNITVSTAKILLQKLEDYNLICEHRRPQYSYLFMVITNLYQAFMENF